MIKFTIIYSRCRNFKFLKYEMFKYYICEFFKFTNKFSSPENIETTEVIASFLFAGPSGTGKTLMARTVSLNDCLDMQTCVLTNFLHSSPPSSSTHLMP